MKQYVHRGLRRRATYRCKKDKHPSCPSPWCHPTEPPKGTKLIDWSKVEVRLYTGEWAVLGAIFRCAKDADGWLFWWVRTSGECGWIKPDEWRLHDNA